VSLIGDVFSTGDSLSLGVSLVLLEIPNDAWIKASIINALNTMTIEGNWAGDNGDITPEQAQQIASLMLQTILFDYEPPIPMTHPIGAIIMFADAGQPEKWLICDGQAVDRSIYADLFAVIGTNYGVGNETTTFNIPDFRDLSPMGAGGSVVGSPGAVQGELEVTLTTGQLPAHNHSVTDPGHSHRMPKQSVTVNAAVNVITPAARTDSLTSPVPMTDPSTTGISIGSTGSGAAHNNLHPVMGTTFLIYAGI
jgi:microcystin-dependent protein